MKILQLALLTSLAGMTASASVIVFGPINPTVLGSGLHATDWTDTILLPKFDSSLGTLTSIKFTLGGTVESTLTIENLENNTQDVTTNVTGNLILRRPDTSQLVLTVPLSSRVDSLAVFDGADDFSGPDTITLTALSADGSNTFTTSAALDLVLFTGSGNISLPVSASGLSDGVGSGNVQTSVDTTASAFASVEYTYTAAVPEPGTISLGAAGLALLWFGARRRRT